MADIVLRAISWEAEVSLEGTLALLEALARDLQADFLPHLPRAMSALADVLDEGARGPAPPRALRAAHWGGALRGQCYKFFAAASTLLAWRHRWPLECGCGGGRCCCSRRGEREGQRAPHEHY